MCFLDWEKTSQQSWHLLAEYSYTFMIAHFAHEKCFQFLRKAGSIFAIKRAHNFSEFLIIFAKNSYAFYLSNNIALLSNLSYQITSDLYWLYFLFKLCSCNLDLFSRSGICSQKASCYFSWLLFDHHSFPLIAACS